MIRCGPTLLSLVGLVLQLLLQVVQPLPLQVVLLLRLAQLVVALEQRPLLVQVHQGLKLPGHEVAWAVHRNAVHGTSQRGGLPYVSRGGGEAGGEAA